MGKLTKRPDKPSSNDEVEAFLQKVATSTPPARHAQTNARLIFALDATASREHTWNQAKRIQARMFTSTESLGGLDIQLCYYQGLDEFHASSWFRNTDELLSTMNSVRCLGGLTQIAKVLQHTIKETSRHPINALVFIGDCMEENVDLLCRHAGRLGVLGVRVFIFQEGHDTTASGAFGQIAKLTGGAHCHFDSSSADQLRDLLSAVATYAAGGMKALTELGDEKGGQARLLAHLVGGS